MIGDRIRMRRTELNMSQDDLAKKLGYKSRSSINKIELGLCDISQSKIQAFANALDTSVSWLMDWENDDSAKQTGPLPEALELLTINPELQLIVKAGAKLSKEDIDLVLQLIEHMKK